MKGVLPTFMKLINEEILTRSRADGGGDGGGKGGLGKKNQELISIPPLVLSTKEYVLLDPSQSVSFSIYLTFLRKLGLYTKLCQCCLFFIYSHYIYYTVLIETI